jgi:hypothetical protein
MVLDPFRGFSNTVPHPPQILPLVPSADVYTLTTGKLFIGSFYDKICALYCSMTHILVKINLAIKPSNYIKIVPFQECVFLVLVLVKKESLVDFLAPWSNQPIRAPGYLS